MKPKLKWSRRAAMALLCVVATSLSLAAKGYCASQTAAPRSAPSMSWLRAEGTRIVDERGQTVVLRGVNLGGWLVEEMWMMPVETAPPPGSSFPKITDHVTLWRVVEGRFGAPGMQRVRRAMRDAWLDESDFRRIRDMGFNSVRLPFLADLLAEPDGWSWLDRALLWARRNGLYVVLDLHGAPGRQSKDHHTGEVGRNALFTRESFVQQTAALWRQVAARYANHPEVAGYDLLNEPMGAPNAATLHIVHDRLYQSIRAVDARHLIFIEDAYKGIETLPHPAAVGWRNIVLSMHSYKFDAKTEDDQVAHMNWMLGAADKATKERNAPFYLGEYNQEPHGTPATQRRLAEAMQARGWSWSLWTYKIIRSGGETSMWGLFRNPQPVTALDPFRDSPEAFIRKTAQLRTETLQEYCALVEALAPPKAAP